MGNGPNFSNVTRNRPPQPARLPARPPQKSLGTAMRDQNGKLIPGEYDRATGQPIGMVPGNVVEPIQKDPALQTPQDRARAFQQSQQSHAPEQPGAPSPQNPADQYWNQMFPRNPDGSARVAPAGGNANPPAKTLSPNDAAKLNQADGRAGAAALAMTPAGPFAGPIAAALADRAANAAQQQAPAQQHPLAQALNPDGSKRWTGPSTAPNPGPAGAPRQPSIAEENAAAQSILDDDATKAVAGKNETAWTQYGPVSSRTPAPGENLPPATITSTGVSRDVGQTPQMQGPNLAGPAGAPNWQQQIVNKHPEIGVAGSSANKAFVDAYKKANPNGGAPSDHMALADSVVNGLQKPAPPQASAPRKPAAAGNPATGSAAFQVGQEVSNLPGQIEAVKAAGSKMGEDAINTGVSAVGKALSDAQAGWAGKSPQEAQAQADNLQKAIDGINPGKAVVNAATWSPLGAAATALGRAAGGGLVSPDDIHAAPPQSAAKGSIAANEMQKPMTAPVARQMRRDYIAAFPELGKAPTPQAPPAPAGGAGKTGPAPQDLHLKSAQGGNPETHKDAGLPGDIPPPISPTNASNPGTPSPAPADKPFSYFGTPTNIPKGGISETDQAAAQGVEKSVGIPSAQARSAMSADESPTSQTGAGPNAPTNGGSGATAAAAGQSGASNPTPGPTGNGKFKSKGVDPGQDTNPAPASANNPAKPISPSGNGATSPTAPPHMASNTVQPGDSLTPTMTPDPGQSGPLTQKGPIAPMDKSQFQPSMDATHMASNSITPNPDFPASFGTSTPADSTTNSNPGALGGLDDELKKNKLTATATPNLGDSPSNRMPATQVGGYDTLS